MRFSLRWQLVATFLAINVLTLAVVAVVDAWLAARRARFNIEQQLNELVATLSQANYPLGDQVLEQIEGLTGARFVLRSSKGDTLAASAPNFAAVLPPPAAKQVTLDKTAEVDGRSYFHAAVTIQRPVDHFEKQTIHIFYSADVYNAARSDAMTPPLLVSLALLPLTTLVVLALARQVAAPIAKLREQVFRISRGDYAVAQVESGTREVRDLSQSVHQMAGMLETYTQQLRKAERLKALSQVNASLVHQLRNALTGCRLALDLHQRMCGAKADDSLVVASRQLQQMGDYVNRFVQVEASTPTPRQCVELGGVLRGVLELAQPIADHLGAKLQVAIADEPLEMNGDLAALRQVMTNLINNALEAASGYTGSGKQAEVCVKLAKDGKSAVLEVGDTGPGIPPELAHQLYEPFATGKPEGLGLGLFVAKTAAESHAGRIEYRRQDDRTWFAVTLPLNN